MSHAVILGTGVYSFSAKPLQPSSSISPSTTTSSFLLANFDLGRLIRPRSSALRSLADSEAIRPLPLSTPHTPRIVVPDYRPLTGLLYNLVAISESLSSPYCTTLNCPSRPILYPASKPNRQSTTRQGETGLIYRCTGCRSKIPESSLPTRQVIGLGRV